MPAPSRKPKPPRNWIASEPGGIGGSGQPDRSQCVDDDPAALGELFARADGSEAGFDQWQAERRARTEAEEAARRAEQLPEAPDTSGYEAWRAEVDEQRRSFERRWGVKLGRRVRVQLHGEARELEGQLHLSRRDDGREASRKGAERDSRSRPLRLRLGKREFLSTQIESLVTVAEPEP